MAEQLDDYDFSAWKRQDRRDRYPFAEWTNGEVWRAVPGEDYRGTALSFRTYLYRKAKKLGLTVSTRIERDETGKDVAVVFRFGTKA